MLPWLKLLPQAISIVEMAGSALSSNKKERAKADKNPSLDPVSLLKRIEVLENNEVIQAELIKQIAQQNLTLIKKAENNYKLALTAILISVVLIAVYSIVFFLNR